MQVEQIWVICARAAATWLVDVTRSVNAESTSKDALRGRRIYRVDCRSGAPLMGSRAKPA
jgi:hypothetical protein